MGFLLTDEFFGIFLPGAHWESCHPIYNASQGLSFQALNTQKEVLQASWHVGLFSSLLLQQPPIYGHLAEVAEVQNLNFTGKTKSIQNAALSSFGWVILGPPWIGVIPRRCSSEKSPLQSQIFQFSRPIQFQKQQLGYISKITRNKKVILHIMEW